MSANNALNQEVVDAVVHSAEVLTGLPTETMIEVITEDREDDTGACLKTQAANIAPVEAMEQEDGTDAAHAKNEDDGEGKAAAFKAQGESDTSVEAMEQEEGPEAGLALKPNDEADNKEAATDGKPIPIRLHTLLFSAQVVNDAVKRMDNAEVDLNVGGTVAADADGVKHKTYAEVVSSAGKQDDAKENEAATREAALLKDSTEPMSEACSLCLRSGDDDAAEDTDSTAAVCGDDDVKNLMDEMKSQLEAAVDGNKTQKAVPLGEATVNAVKDAGFEPEEVQPEGANAESPAAATKEAAPQVIVEYLIATDSQPLDFPAIGKILEQSFGPKLTSTPKKEQAEARPGTPMPPKEPKPDEAGNSREDGNSRDSWNDDESFEKKMAESGCLLVVMPGNGKVLDDWKPTKSNFFAVLGSGITVHRCRDVCYSLETTLIIRESRNIEGFEKVLLGVPVNKAAARMAALDVAHPLPANGFRAHLIVQFSESERIVATVYRANRETFVDELVDKFTVAARQLNLDWTRVYQESALHLFVDVSRSTNGNHVPHPLNHRDMRHRIDNGVNARRDLLRCGKRLQEQWKFSVYFSYGITTPDGREF